MVTGLAGSIDSELVRQIAALRPSAPLLVDQTEPPQHDIRLMMARECPYIECHTVVADISNMVRMEDLIGSLRPDYVFHTAAYKHVPMMEDGVKAMATAAKSLNYTTTRLFCLMRIT